MNINYLVVNASDLTHVFQHLYFRIFEPKVCTFSSMYCTSEDGADAIEMHIR